VAAIERGVLDPLPETNAVSHLSADPQTEISGISIYKTWREASIVTMAVNKSNAFGAHFPRLLNHLPKRRSAYVVGMTAV
jgi:hypothetical protein